MSYDGLMQKHNLPYTLQEYSSIDIYDHISGDIKIPTYDVITF